MISRHEAPEKKSFGSGWYLDPPFSLKVGVSYPPNPTLINPLAVGRLVAGRLCQASFGDALLSEVIQAKVIHKKMLLNCSITVSESVWGRGEGEGGPSVDFGEKPAPGNAVGRGSASGPGCPAAEGRRSRRARGTRRCAGGCPPSRRGQGETPTRAARTNAPARGQRQPCLSLAITGGEPRQQGAGRTLWRCEISPPRHMQIWHVGLGGWPLQIHLTTIENARTSSTVTSCTRSKTLKLNIHTLQELEQSAPPTGSIHLVFVCFYFAGTKNTICAAHYPGTGVCMGEAHRCGGASSGLSLSVSRSMSAPMKALEMNNMRSIPTRDEN